MTCAILIEKNVGAGSAMFRLSITTLSLLVALVLPAKTGQSAESCADLAAHYDRLNRHNALLFAESMGDNSAPARPSRN